MSFRAVRAAAALAGAAASRVNGRIVPSIPSVTVRSFSSSLPSFSSALVTLVASKGTKAGNSHNSVALKQGGRPPAVPTYNTSGSMCAMSTLLGTDPVVATSPTPATGLGEDDEEAATTGRLKGRLNDAALINRKKKRSVVFKSEGIAAQLKAKLDADLEAIERAKAAGARYNPLSQAFEDVKKELAHDPERLAMLEDVYNATTLRTGSQQDLVRAKIKAVVEYYQRRAGDTGSAEVQVAVLTERLANMQSHLMRHKNDIQLKREYARLLYRRRKMFIYLRKQRFRTYQVLVRDLGIDENEVMELGRLTYTRPYLPVEKSPKRHRNWKRTASNKLTGSRKPA